MLRQTRRRPNSDTIGSVRSIDDLLKDKRLVAYALQAYGFKGQDISNEDLRKILTSNPQDPKSFVNQKGNTGFLTFMCASRWNRKPGPTTMACA